MGLSGSSASTVWPPMGGSSPLSSEMLGEPDVPCTAGSPPPPSLQAVCFEFAIGPELVRQHRGSFAPLWTTGAGPKLMIWLGPQQRGSAIAAASKAPAAALGPALAVECGAVLMSVELDGSA